MDERSWTWTIVLLVTLFTQHSNSVSRKLNASQAFDETWSTTRDLENELEQKRSKGFQSGSGSYGSASGGLNSQWSSWSDWSTCSRTCDGGIMQQIRRCYNPGGCKGESVRYRICNMQPCPEHQDFRARQCAAYNDVPYDGTLYKWTPHYDYIEPCALTCRGRPAHLTEESLLEAEGTDDSEHYDEPSVIVQLSTKVQDGTRCRSGSLDMCIQGKCLRVGCDLKLGSTKKIDACGVCGGDGSSCSQALYQWETAPMSPCSVTCGGGYKMSRPTCRNRITGAEADDTLCSVANRPEPSVEFCNTHTCPPRWIADDWSLCSRLCGTGYRERMVVCAEETNGIKTRVSDVMCRGPRPPIQESCIIEECPKWEVEEWSACSKPCGQGIQMRAVECKSSDGSLSAKCDPLTKPAAAQQCNIGIPCEVEEDGSETEGVPLVGKNTKSTSGGTIIIGRSGPPPAEQQYTEEDEVEEDDTNLPRNVATDEDEDDDDDDSDDDDEDDDDSDSDSNGGGDKGKDVSFASYNDQPPKFSKQLIDEIHHDETNEPRVQELLSSVRNNDAYFETKQPSADPSFIKDTDWTPCSVSCGEGLRRRPFRCKIFLEYSRTIETVNDSLCEDPKPHDEVERCFQDPCILHSKSLDAQYPRDSVKGGTSEPGKNYVWREQGYTSCSASCLGGVEELIVNCVREDNGRVVSPFLCNAETKPETRIRTCNDRPCPPRWNYSDYTPCSKSCGIGIKTREVQCIHEVTRGGDSSMVVPNSMCPQPPPADRQYCNVLDCPVRWEVGEWSKCSHTCGYGIKERKVECKQIMAQEHKIERPESMCPNVKPPDKKPCNVKPCPPEDPKPIISVRNTTHIQHDLKKSKITLKIGGAGVVFFGTQVKIKCPVKRYNRTKIKWSKDHKPLARSRRFKVSKKGALRILNITFADAGIYSCHAGLSSAETNIEVKPRPGQPHDEIKNQESERLVAESTGIEALTSADMTTAENISEVNQTTRGKQQKNGRERNRRPKSENMQKQQLETNLMEDENSKLVQQQAQDGEGLAQQASSASSGGSRTKTLLQIPYFQALLSNLQKFKNSRGQHMLHDKDFEYGLDLAHFEQDEPMQFNVETMPQIATKDTTTITPSTPTTHEELTKQVNGQPSVSFDRKTTHRTHLDNFGNGALSFGGSGNYSSAFDDTLSIVQTYIWRMGAWSICSQKCDADGSGLRYRTVNCVRFRRQRKRSTAVDSKDTYRTMNEELSTTMDVDGQTDEMTVDRVHCELQNGKMPDAFESCGNEECPQWVTGKWTLCEKSRCVERNVAIQRRAVSCRYSNGTLASNLNSKIGNHVALRCEEYDKPVGRQECYSEHCEAIWRVEPWSECNAPCGRQGIKYRILQCVWQGTRQPAGNSCKQLPRPIIMKTCKSPSCRTKAQMRRCKDTSRYCQNVQSMGLCRLHRYQEKCCKSCKIIPEINLYRKSYASNVEAII